MNTNKELDEWYALIQNNKMCKVKSGGVINSQPQPPSFQNTLQELICTPLLNDPLPKTIQNMK